MNGVPGSPDACLRCGGDVAADRDFCDWCGGVHPELCTCPQCARDRLLSHPDGPVFDLDPAGDYLVTRLYNSLAAVDLCHEAAREITRLRIQVWKDEGRRRILAAIAEEIGRLNTWKAEATAVIEGWEQVFDLVPAPFRAQHLGDIKADVVLAYFRAVDNRHEK